MGGFLGPASKPLNRAVALNSRGRKGGSRGRGGYERPRTSLAEDAFQALRHCAEALLEPLGRIPDDTLALPLLGEAQLDPLLGRL